MHLMQLLFSVRINVYSTECCIFACVGELPAKGLLQVTDLLPEFFAACRSVRAVPRMDHITHLGRISPRDWLTKSCKRAAKADGTDHVHLAFRGLAFLPADCAALLLGREADKPDNFFEASAGLLSLLTVQDPPIEVALDWLQFSYTADRAGA